MLHHYETFAIAAIVGLIAYHAAKNDAMRSAANAPIDPLGWLSGWAQ